MGGISIWQLLIIFAIVALLFGTRKLRNIGGDIGGAVRGFKEAMGEEEKSTQEQPRLQAEGAAADYAETAKAETSGPVKQNKH